MKKNVYYYIEDVNNEFSYAPKIIKYHESGYIERYDFIKKDFVEDFDMSKIFFGGIEASKVTEKEAYEAIEKFTKRFYS